MDTLAKSNLAGLYPPRYRGLVKVSPLDCLAHGLLWRSPPMGESNTLAASSVRLFSVRLFTTLLGG